MLKSVSSLLLLFTFIFTSAFSQIPGRFQVPGPDFFAGESSLNTVAMSLPYGKPKHYIAFALRTTGSATKGNFEIRIAPAEENNSTEWGPWVPLGIDEHLDLPTGQRQYELVFFPADTRTMELRASSFDADIKTEYFFYSPIDFSDSEPAPQPAPEDFSACPCALPDYVNRADWGGPPNQQPGCTPSYTNVTHLFIHHQAGVANPPYAAVVLGIWQHHVFTNGWCDVGYHWLVAPDGTIFQGRAGGNNVVGAHATGLNQNTMAVCFLGNFQNDEPTPEALESLSKLLAWKCCDSDIDPIGASVHAGSGLTFNHISGHRDGAATLCPGDNLYAQLPYVRNRTDSFYRDPTGCDGFWPPANDACANAVLLSSAEFCSPTAATTDYATASGVSIPMCSGFTSSTALDVWFRFQAVENLHRVTVTPVTQSSGGLDAVVAVYAGSCGAQTLVACVDAPGGAGAETVLDLPGLSPGQFYYVRIFDYGSAPAQDGRFEICVTHGPTVRTKDQLARENVMLLFPNPTSGKFTVQLPQSGAGGGTIRIFNIAGRVLMEKNIRSAQLEFDLSHLPTGIYLVEFRSEKGAVRQRLILE